MLPDEVDIRLNIATKIFSCCSKRRNPKLKIHKGDFKEKIEPTFEGTPGLMKSRK